MATITQVLKSPSGENEQYLFLDTDGDGCAINVDDLIGDLDSTREMLSMLPGIAPWYKPEDVQKWKEHFVGYTTVKS